MEKYRNLSLLLGMLSRYNQMLELANIGAVDAAILDSLSGARESLAVRANCAVRSSFMVSRFILDRIHEETKNLSSDCAELVQRACESVDLPSCTGLFRTVIHFKLNGERFLLSVTITLQHSCRSACVAVVPLQEYVPIYMSQCSEMITAQLEMLNIPIVLDEVNLAKI